MAKLALALFFLPAMLCFGGCAAEPRGARPLTVFAAASLIDLASDLGEIFENEHGIEVVLNFAASSTLAQQIRAAPRAADVFLSADGAWVDVLEQVGYTLAGSRQPLLRNRLVIAARRDSEVRITEPLDLARAEYRFLAVADPEAVPAGRYARAHLERLPWKGESMWRAVAGRLAPTLDARAALALAASDREAVGIVYRSDVAASSSMRVLCELPTFDDVPIVYWAVLLDGAASADARRSFVDLLGSTEARGLIEHHGFEPFARPDTLS